MMETFTIHRHGQHADIRLSGDLTAETVPELQLSLREHLAAGVSSLQFDLADSLIVDSSGIGLLIAAANSVARLAGRIEVTRVSADIFQLLQCMRLVDRLHVRCASAEEVLRG